MTRAVEPIRLLEYGAGLLPARTKQWVAAVPVQEAERVVRSATKRSGIGQPEVIAVPEGLKIVNIVPDLLLLFLLAQQYTQRLYIPGKNSHVVLR